MPINNGWSAQQETDISQEKIDNLRTAAHELRKMTVLPPKAEIAPKAAR